MLDKDFLDGVMNSAGIGAAIGWVIQFYMWRSEKEERQGLTKFIMEQLVTITTEKAIGTASITTLTTAVNALMALVKGGRV
jgi:hypothetical protein